MLPQIFSIHRVTDDGLTVKYLDSEGQVQDEPIHWLAFANLVMPAGMKESHIPSVAVYYSTRVLPDLWLPNHYHLTNEKGKCHCDYADCRQLGLAASSIDADLRRGWLAKLEDQRQYRRDYAARRKAEKEGAQ
jgi:hypothetical protein